MKSVIVSLEAVEGVKITELEEIPHPLSLSTGEGCLIWSEIIDVNPC
jgi:hypothetical protein